MEEEIICNRWTMETYDFTVKFPFLPADTNDDFLFEH